MAEETNGLELAQLLKGCCRQENGFFVEEDPAESSIYMLHLSQHYFNIRSKDMRNYLYAAGLLASAKLRNPDDDEVDEKMEELWKKLLLEAKSQHKDAQLQPIVKELKDRVAKMRSEARREIEELTAVEGDKDKRLQEEKKVEAAEKVFRRISESYMEIMRFISDTCCRILFGDQLPCKFAHLAFGSLARLEGTPYSDFENAIVIEKSKDEEERKNAQRFRFYIVVFQVLVLNLGETPLRLLGVPLLNDFYADGGDWFYDNFAKSGIQFDSNMPIACVHPLYKKPNGEDQTPKELIGTVEQIGRFVESDEVLKNGYHLADVLCQSRLVAGDAALHDEYKQMIAAKLRDRKDWIRYRIKNSMQLHDSVDKLCAPVSKRNIKRLIYRGLSITISHLGNLFGARSASCFEIVDELMAEGKLANETGHDLKYAVALAGEVRLKIYMTADEQVAETDVVSDANGKKILAEVIQAVGEVAICDLFYVTHTLWRGLLPFITEDSTPETFTCDRAQVSEDMRLAIRSTLFGGISDEDAVPRLAEREDRNKLDKLGLLQLSRVATSHLLAVFDLLKSVLRQNDELQPTVDVKSTLMSKMDDILQAYSICQKRLERPSSFLAEETCDSILLGRFFAGQESSRLNFTRIAKDISEVFRIGLQDQKISKIIPDVLLLIFLLADFVTTFINAIDGYLRKTEDSQLIVDELDDLCKKMEDFRLALPAKNVEISDSVGSVDLAKEFMQGFDDGLFSEDNVVKGIDKWLCQVEKVRLLFLLPDQVLFHTKINDILGHLLDIRDWSFIIPTHGKAIRRDAGILLADLRSLRGVLLSRSNLHERACEEFLIGQRLLEENSRSKRWFRFKLAANLHNVGKSLLLCERLDDALIWFRKELDYRFTELPGRTTNEQLASNYHFQAECLRKIGTEESIAEAEMYAESELELSAHV